MNPEENDSLWNLLGKAGKKPEVSPTFAQDVTRLARQLGTPKGGFWRNLFAPSENSGWNWTRSAVASAGFAVLILASVFLLNRNPDPTPTSPQTVNLQPATGVDSPLSSDPVLEVIEDEMGMIDHLDALVTVGDVDDLADEEIAMLLF